MKSLTIGLLQLNFRNAFREKFSELSCSSDYRETLEETDFCHNQDVLLAQIRQSAAAGAELILTPESYLDGWSFDSGILERVAVDLDNSKVSELRKLASELGVWLCASLFLREGGRTFNSAILIDSEGALALVYRKIHETKDVLEHMPYDLGDELPVVQTPWGRVGILICHDRWYAEAYHSLRLQGAELILNPVAAATFWPGHPYHDIHRCNLRCHAYSSSVFLACCNSANHGGHSLIIAPDGSAIAEAGQGEEILMHRLDPSAHSSYDFVAGLKPSAYRAAGDRVDHDEK